MRVIEFRASAVVRRRFLDIPCILLAIASAASLHAQPNPGAASSAAPSSGQNDQPIVSDDEFNKAIPPLDQSPPPPADQPGAVPGALAPAPEISPDIDQPLTPLQSFNVQPFEDSRYTEAEDKKASTTRYAYRIEGLEDLRDNAPVAPISGGDIVDQFHGLSALEKGDGKAANGAMISARMQEDQQLLIDVLNSQGYFDASVHGGIELPQNGQDAPLTVLLSATPGPRYALGTIRFDAPPVVPEDLIRKAFAPKPGEPIVADRILGAEANIKVVLPENGYPFVDIGQRDILLDAQTRTGDYTLPVTPGPRSKFGDIRVGGKKPVFKPDHIALIARFKKGDPYDSRKIDDLRQALVATGLLATVSVNPEQTGVPAGDGTEYAAIEVDQEAGPPRTLSAQAGYATGEGFKLQGSWTHHNLFPPEGALIIQGTAGTQEQSLGATFRRSNAGRRDRSVQFGINVDHSDTDAFEAYTGQISGRISYDSTPIWQKRFTYSYGFELIGSHEQDYDFAAGERRDRTYYVFALPGQATFDTSNNLLDPTRGFRISASLSPETSLGSGAQIYARTILQGTGYYPVADSVVLAGRLRVGSIAGAARAQIAPSRRFYAGGGGSVRGFGYQEVGPKDPDARPIGGRSLVEASTEVRYRFGNWGIVGFVDGGQVYTSELPRFTDWRMGVGVGARFYTNVGPVRLDVATPINRQAGESRISVYVSIGQAF